MWFTLVFLMSPRQTFKYSNFIVSSQSFFPRFSPAHFQKFDGVRSMVWCHPKPAQQHKVPHLSSLNSPLMMRVFMSVKPPTLRVVTLTRDVSACKVTEMSKMFISISLVIFIMVLMLSSYPAASAQPEWLQVMSDSEVEISSELHWTCLAAGKPRPSVRWLRNGQPLSTQVMQGRPLS